MSRTKGAKDKRPRSRRAKTGEEKKKLARGKFANASKGTASISDIFSSRGTSGPPRVTGMIENGGSEVDNGPMTANEVNGNGTSESRDAAEHDTIVFSEKVANVHDDDHQPEIVANLDVEDDDLVGDIGIEVESDANLSTGHRKKKSGI